MDLEELPLNTWVQDFCLAQLRAEALLVCRRRAPAQHYTYTVLKEDKGQRQFAGRAGRA